MRWFSLSLILLLISCFIYTASAEEPPENLFSGSAVIEETHTVFKHQDGLSFIILWKEDNLNWSIELENISIFLNDFSGEGVFPGEKGTTSEDYVQLNASAPTGDYNIIIDLTYTQLSGDTVTKRYEYPMSYIEPFRITRIILPSNTSYGFTIEIETFVFLSKITMRFDSDGDIDLDKKRIERRNIPPGNYSFKTKATPSHFMYKDGGQQEVAYHIIAINGSHIMELYEYNIIVNVVWEDTTLYIPLITVIVLSLILVIYVFYRRRKRLNSAE